MRLPLALAAALLCTTILSTGAYAQGTAATPAAPPAHPAAPDAAATPPKGDPVVARVGGEEIHLSDMGDAAQSLPDEVRSMPPQVLYPMLLDQMIDRKTLVIAARKQGLDKDPAVLRAIARATDQALQNALLSRDLGPSVTDAAIKARYDATLAKKSGEEEVHARHILVTDEATAKKIIDQLNHGGDFTELAKKNSTDPAAQQGGDLGFFKKSDMVPEFANAAFALQAGQVTQTPVHTQFGWHVIKVEEKRTAPAPTFEQSRDEIRQQIIQEGVRADLEKLKVGVPVEKFAMDGGPLPPTPTPTPTPPANPATDAPATPGTKPAPSQH
jgi:peptidyl-prolyl cis-trans isomerase C